MRDRLVTSALLCLVITASCGGGSSSDGGVVVGGGGSSLLSAGFLPDVPNPGSMTVSLAEGSRSEDTITLEVRLTGIDDLFGAALDVGWDPAIAEFVAWSAGGLLESGGESVTYQVSAAQPGVVVVGASRAGGAPGLTFQGTGTLIRLTLRVIAVGSAGMSFGNASLFDGQAPPVEIGGLQWFGGTLSAN